MKQNEVKSFKILQDRSKTNIFVSNCVGGEKRKKTKLRFFWNKAKKNEYNRSAIIEDLPLLSLRYRLCYACDRTKCQPGPAGPPNPLAYHQLTILAYHYRLR